MSGARREAARWTLALATASLLLAACPVALPPNLREATVLPDKLPASAAELLTYAENEEKEETAAAQENVVVAVDKGLKAEPHNYELLWRGARACAWLAEEFTDKSRRGSYAQKGLDYAKVAVQVDPGRVQGHYYEGINLGWSATTKTVGAYIMVPKVVKAGQAAMKIDEKFDHAGPARLIGTVYAKAPPWPASIGDVEEGIKFLARAVELAPDFPQNHLHYGDALVSDGKLNEAEHEYQLVLAAPVLPEWSYRAERWKHDAAMGMKRIAEKRSE